MNNKKTRGWTDRQVSDFVNIAINAHKEVWKVVPSVRRAIIAETFASVVTGLDRSDIPTVYLENLWDDMCAEACKYGMGDARFEL